MLYYKNSFNKVNTDSYALYFNGVNNYLQNSVSTKFNSPSRSQAQTWLFKFNITDLPVASQLIFTNNGINDEIYRYAAQVSISPLRFIFQARNPLGVRSNILSVPISLGNNIIHVISNGIGNNPFEIVYVNGVNVGTTTLTATLNSSDSQFAGLKDIRIGRNLGTFTNYFKGVLEEISIVNYAKNITEVNADVTAGTQLGLDANFLFRLKTIYPTNITTLDSTSTFKELKQNLDMQFINYPNPLVLDTNLIKI